MITNAIKSSRGFEDDRILVMQSNHKEKSSNFKKFNESRMKMKIVSKSPKCSNNISNSDENYLDSNAEFHSRDTKEDKTRTEELTDSKKIWTIKKEGSLWKEDLKNRAKLEKK